MAASNAILGYNTTFSIDDGTGSFDLIAEISNIDPPDQQTSEVDVTHMTSPGKVREFIAGLEDPGEMSFDINWIPNDATDVILRALKNSGAVRSMRVTWPNGVTSTFPGFIKGYKKNAPIDDKMSAAITVRVAGSTVDA